MTDTPPVVSVPPPPLSERIKGFIGDLARPFAIYAVAFGTTWAIIGNATADKLGAAGLILAALFGAKSFEVSQQTKATASVDKAKVDAGVST
jgi:hypothetical protein